jgi:hypothetical protein
MIRNVINRLVAHCPTLSIHTRYYTPAERILQAGCYSLLKLTPFIPRLKHVGFLTGKRP